MKFSSRTTTQAPPFVSKCITPSIYFCFIAPTFLPIFHIVLPHNFWLNLLLLIHLSSSSSLFCQECYNHSWQNSVWCRWHDFEMVTSKMRTRSATSSTQLLSSKQLWTLLKNLGMEAQKWAQALFHLCLLQMMLFCWLHQAVTSSFPSPSQPSM